MQHHTAIGQDPMPLPPPPDALWRLLPANAAAEATRPGSHPAEQPYPSTEPTAAQPAASIERQPHGWSITWNGITIIAPKRKGFAYIASLLESPNRGVPAVTLKASVDHCDPALLQHDQGPVADETTMAEIMAALQELDAELEEAMEASQWSRQEAIERQKDELVAALSAVTGLGGRKRQRHGADRCRVSVTNAIRRALATLEPLHPELTTYLHRTICTGMVCRYTPTGSECWLVAA